MTTCTRLAAAVTALSCVQLVSAGTITVLLDEAHQGQGNLGTEFRPVDENGDLAALLLTARSRIDADNPFDPDAAGEPGTVYIDKDDKGAGVQNAGGGGSSGISGGGGDKDEELVITYDSPTLASSVQVGLFDFEAGDGLLDKDDPVLFINVSGLGETLVLDELAFLPAFTATGDKEGFIDFGLLGLGPGALVESFGVRETHGHLFVNFVTAGTATPIPLPAPVAMGLVGLVGVGVARRRHLLVR